MANAYGTRGTWGWEMRAGGAPGEGVVTVRVRGSGGRGDAPGAATQGDGVRAEAGRRPPDASLYPSLRDRWRWRSGGQTTSLPSFMTTQPQREPTRTHELRKAETGAGAIGAPAGSRWTLCPWGLGGKRKGKGARRPHPPAKPCSFAHSAAELGPRGCACNGFIFLCHPGIRQHRETPWMTRV